MNQSVTNELSAKVVKELSAQRDFLLANTWVKWAPKEKGEGCLVGRMDKAGVLATNWLSAAAAWRLLHVIGHEHQGEELLVTLGNWNDTTCRSAGEAIAVLDEAIRIAKEDMS